jgi:iodotyrosine deiodinase
VAAEPSFVPLEFRELDLPEMRARGKAFYEALSRRRSVRDFDSRPVPRDLLESAIASAGTAPSGAHMQPWTFVVVGDPATKAKIREAAEREEYESYHGRMSDEWLEALAAIGTDWRKPFLETAPWLVILFAQRYGVRPDGTKRKHYYVQESCGIAAGLFIAALHTMGLATLTHTPSPMGFLRDVLGRPHNEVPFVLFPVGFPAEDARVPDIARKPLDEVAVWHEAP